MNCLNQIPTVVGIVICTPALIVMGVMGLTVRVVICPFHRYDQWRLNRVVKKWVKALSDEDRGYLEQFIGGEFKLKRLYKLVPRKGNVGSKCMDWLDSDNHICSRTLLKTEHKLPRYLLFSRLLDIPANDEIRTQLGSMLFNIKMLYRDNPDADGFTDPKILTLRTNQIIRKVENTKRLGSDLTP